MTETQLQVKINADLKKKGIKFRHIEKGRYHKQKTHRAGWPDLMILPGYGQVFFVELKSPGKILTLEQTEFRTWANEMGYHFYVVDTLCHWEVVKRLEGVK